MFISQIILIALLLKELSLLREFVKFRINWFFMQLDVGGGIL